MRQRTAGILSLLLLILMTGSAVRSAGGPPAGALAQNPSRTPTETMRQFYQMLREKKFREAFGLSIYRSAIDSLSAQEFDDLRPDFDRMAQAVTEKMPAQIDVSGEQ